MRQRIAILATAGLVLAAVLMSACEDNGVTAPTDGTIQASANPGTVVIDPNNATTPRDVVNGQFKAESTVTGVLLSKDGAPLEGVTVFFSTAGGRLVQPHAPGTPEVPMSAATTDSQGVVRATLILTENDPDDVEVTLTSSSLSDEVIVQKNVVGNNQSPVASINTTPCQRAVPTEPCGGNVNDPVTFNGSQSIDPDQDDEITMYKWTIASTDPNVAREEVETTFDAIERTYTSVQDLTVTLSVTDDPAAPQLKAEGKPVPYDHSETVTYKILCENDPPIAVGPADIQRPNQATFPVAIVLDAGNSRDTDGTIQLYRWDCGNGNLATTGGAPFIGVCNYTAPGTYTAVLTVFDNGTGVIDPDTSNFECQKSDTDDVIVTITAPGQ